MRKRGLAWVLTLVMLLSILPLGAAESQFTLNGKAISYSDYLTFTDDIQYLAASTGTTYHDFQGCTSTPIPDMIRQIENGEYR